MALLQGADFDGRNPPRPQFKRNSTVHLQALTLQQQTLNRQVQEIAEAVQASGIHHPTARSPRVVSGVAGTPAFAVLVGGASALAVCTLLKLMRY